MLHVSRYFYMIAIWLVVGLNKSYIHEVLLKKNIVFAAGIVCSYAIVCTKEIQTISTQ